MVLFFLFFFSCSFFFVLLGAVQIKTWRSGCLDGGVALFFRLGELKVAPSWKGNARGVMSEARGKIR